MPCLSADSPFIYLSIHNTNTTVSPVNKSLYIQTSRRVPLRVIMQRPQASCS